MSAPLISVIVPTHERAEIAARLIESLRLQDIGDQAEFLFVSNFDDLALSTLVHETADPRFRFFVAGKLGCNSSRNRGLERARGQIALMLDDDCRLPDEGFLRRVISVHAEFPDATAIGGNYESPPHLNLVSRTYNLICNTWLQADRLAHHETKKLLGGCVSYKLGDLRAANLRFNEAIIYGGTEAEFHYRMAARGHRLLFHPNLFVIHDPRIGLRSLGEKAFRQGHSKQKYLMYYTDVRHERKAPRFESISLTARWIVSLYQDAFALGEKRAQNNAPAAPRNQDVAWILLRAFLGWSFLHRSVLNPAKGVLIDFFWATLVPFYYRVIAPLPSRVWSFAYWQIWAPIKGGLIHYYWKIFGAWHRSVGFVIRTYWTFYPIFYFLKRNWRSPWWIGKVRLPLTYPNLQTSGEPLWIYRDKFKALKFGETTPDSDQRAMLCIADINSQAEQVVHWLNKLPQTQPVHFVINDSPRVSKLRLVFDFLKNDQSQRELTFELKTSRLVTEFEYFRWIYRFSAACESHSLLWRPLYFIEPEREHLFVQTDFVHSNRPDDTTPLATRPRLSVVIPHHDDFENLKGVLLQLERQTLCKNDFEVIVVDNAVSSLVLNEPEKKAILSTQLNLSLLQLTSENAELYLAGHARNEGLRLAQADRILFLDSDILLPNDFLDKLIVDLDTNDVVMAKRFMLREKFTAQDLSSISTKDLYREDEYWEAFRQAERWTDLSDHWKYSCTYCFAVKKESLLRAGSFDRAFTKYGFEDVDLGFRLFKLGLKFSFAALPVYHLYANKAGHNYHWDQEKRMQALKTSAFTLFRLRPERLPFILCQGYFAPTLLEWFSSLLKPITMWRAKRKVEYANSFLPVYATDDQDRKRL